MSGSVRWLGRLAGAVTWALVACVLIAVAALGAAWLSDLRLQSVGSASMAPTVPAGSLAVVRSVAGDAVEVGDVVTFRDPADPARRVMHRVVAVTTGRDGQRFLEVKGDANRTPDPLLVASSGVDGELAWHVPRLGDALEALRPPAGLVVLGGLPLVLFALDVALARRARLLLHPRGAGGVQDRDAEVASSTPAGTA